MQKISQEEWAVRKGSEEAEVKWLRFTQKRPDKKSFLVNDLMHGGSHMQLVVFTYNPSGNRSKPNETLRNQNFFSEHPNGMRTAAQSSASARRHPFKAAPPPQSNNVAMYTDTDNCLVFENCDPQWSDHQWWDDHQWRGDDRQW